MHTPQVHVFSSFLGLPEAKAAWRSAAKFMAKCLGRPVPHAPNSWPNNPRNDHLASKL